MGAEMSETVADKIRQIVTELPDFVKMQPPLATEPLSIGYLNWWAPDKTGIPATDYPTGAGHFHTALAYSQAEDSALFIFNILMSMQHEPIGAIERGFIDAAARLAIRCRIPPAAPDEWVPVIAHTIEEAERARENEAAMGSALELSRTEFPTLAAYLVIDHLEKRSERQPIDFGIWRFASAALNGSKH